MIRPILESVSKALIINNNDEVLILTLGEHNDRPEKSYKPDLPGGLVDPGETEPDAVAREVMEETGIKLPAEAFELAYARTAYFDSENKSVTKFLYITRLSVIPEVTLSWEHSAYRWVPLSDLMKSIELRSFYKEAIEYCFGNEILSISS